MPHSISQLSPVQCPGVLFYCMDFGQINGHCVYLFDILIFEPVFMRERVQVIEIIPAFNLFHKKIIFNASSYGLCSAVLHLCQHINSLYMLRQIIILVKIKEKYRCPVRRIIMPETFL